MKHILTKNIGLKIVALLFAAIMWIVVTNINDPSTSRVFNNVPVQIINAHLLEDTERVFWVLENTDVVNWVTIHAPRSVVSRINHENIIARADISDLSSLDTIAITFEVDNLNQAEYSTIQSSSSILKLQIEARRSRSVQIRPSIQGDIAEGYIMGDVINSPTVVTITGPDSQVASVAYAEFFFDVTNINYDIRTNADIVLYDFNGRPISRERISLNTEQVSLTIPIFETKSIPIRYTTTGSPANGYRVTGDDEISHQSIMIAGRSIDLYDITEIVIPPIDLNESTETVVRNININEFLPNNIRLANLTDNILRISIGIEEEASRLITLRDNQIRFTNVPNDYIAALYDFTETSPITLIGLQRDLNIIQPSMLIGEIDVARWMASRNIAQLNEGNFQMPIDINIGNNITIANNVTVMVNIRYEELE